MSDHPRRGFGALTFLSLLCATGWAEEISGRVYDKLDKPIPKPEVCLYPDSTRCVTGDDSGGFRIEVPSGIRGQTGMHSFGIGIGGGKAIWPGIGPRKHGLEWFDIRGRRLPESGMEVEDLRAPHGSGTAQASGLPKRSAPELPDLQITKSGYKTRYLRPFSDSDNWVTLTSLGDSGFVRTLTLESDLRVDREAKTLHLTTTHKHCGPQGWDTSVTRGTQSYAFSSGKLYIYSDGESCTGTRLEGSGSDILGAWRVETDEARLPPEILSPTCRDLFRGNPGPFMASMIYRISEAKFGLEITGESCSGWEVFADIRNFFRSDAGVTVAENTCRGSKFLNAHRDTAAITYRPHGSRDSLQVRFEYRNTVCSYVDPLLFADPSPTCPEAWRPAQQEFYACIRSSGFSAITNPAPKRGLWTRASAGKDHFGWSFPAGHSQNPE